MPASRKRVPDAAAAEHQQRAARRARDISSAATLEGVSICSSAHWQPDAAQLRGLLRRRIGAAVGQHDEGMPARFSSVSTSTAPGSTS